MLATLLPAQDPQFREAFARLASPTAVERAIAVNDIASIKGDIGAAARVAFKSAGTAERRGLFEAFELRGDNALILPAIQILGEEGVPGTDSRAVDAAREYVLALPESKLTMEESSLQPAALAAWRDVQRLWLRLQISEALVDALQKPGKFLGQFESLRRRDGGALDRELAALVELDNTYLDAIEGGATRRYGKGIEAERMFSSSWRKLGSALGNFEVAMQTLRGELEEDGKPGESLLSAVEVLFDLRVVAIRALASSADGQKLAPTLRLWHLALQGYEPPATLRSSITVDNMRTEIEITLARFGHRELLDARLEVLRSQVERFAQTAANVNARIANRPDIAARNETAHLLLRCGDYAAAETEWLSLLKDSHEIERLARDSQRSAVASFLGSLYYNLACAQSLQLKLTRAGQSLENAVANGYRDFAWMLEDGDLELLRRTDKFRSWFAELAPPALVDRLPVVD